MVNRMKCLTIRVAMVLLVAALLVAGAVTAYAAQSEAHCYLYGDVLEDGQITNRDAIQLLYYAVLDTQSMPSYQDCDIDGDGQITSLDAIELLYLYMYGTETQVVHAYYDPAWEWPEYQPGADLSKVNVTFRCVCGEKHGDMTADVTVVTTQEPTCTEAGELKRTATITVSDGKTYTGTHTDILPATGHSANTQGLTCKDADSACTNPGCTYVAKAPAHSWQTISVDPATCVNNTVTEHQVCQTCDATQEVELEGQGDHVLTYEGDRLVSGCTYVKTYRCSGCNQVFDGTNTGDTFTKHTYKLVLTKEATCQEDGQLTPTCSACGATSSVQTVPKDDQKHTWDAGTSDGTTITYTCTDCQTTKTAVDASQNGQVNTNALAGEAEVVVREDGASMSMDADAQAGLDQNRQVEITVTEVDKETLGLGAQEESQIGDNTIYDFNMSYVGATENISSFEGYITIRLPYTPAEGENVDDTVNVWFIREDGQVEAIQAAYSNGFVTFQTDHFSYYTVTRLTPAQRCELYGHSYLVHNRAATCTVDGVKSSICQRCGQKEYETQRLPKTGHHYEESTCEATCTEAGAIIKTCLDCNHEITTRVEKLGHSMEVSAELSKAATCQATGEDVYVCTRCGQEGDTVITPQLIHQFGNPVHVEATCTTGGYDEGTCTLCGQKAVSNVTVPTGHEYQVSQWQWSDDYSAATVQLVCAHDASHTHTVKANVQADTSKAVCEGVYTVEYVATASANNVTYTSEPQIMNMKGNGHVLAQDWTIDNTQHAHMCTVCGEAVDAAAHNWQQVSVDKAPTCVNPGSKTESCAVCGHQRTAPVPATGEHNYVNGVCSVCNKEEGACEHLIVYPETVDTSGLNICGNPTIVFYRCDCGRYHGGDIQNQACAMEYSEKTVELEDGTQRVIQMETCAVCGWCAEYYQDYVLCEGTCAAEYFMIGTIRVGDTLIANLELGMQKRFHPTVNETSRVTLEGFCGNPVMVTMSCPCGQSSNTYATTEGQCKYAYDPELSTEEEVLVCSVCGGQQIMSYGGERVGCLYKETMNCRYVMNGEVVLSFTNTWFYDVHDYVVTSYEMLGETCQDGVVVRTACKNCGEADAYYSMYDHDLVKTEIVDLSQTGMCYDAIEIATCPCPAAASQMHLVGETICQWQTDAYDWAAGHRERLCSVCGARWVEDTTYSPKDENCNTIKTVTNTFTAADGTLIATVVTRGFEEQHVHGVERIELNGETCQDGGTVYYWCTDCGQDLGKGTFSGDGHYFIRTEEISTGEFGTCGDTYYLMTCACGERSHIEQDRYTCEFEYREDDESMVCRLCGLVENRRFEELEQIDACYVKTRHTLTLSKDGVILGTLVAEGIEDRHNVITEFTLLGETCEDGYYYKEVCLTCDEILYDSAEHNDIRNWHETYTVSRELVLDNESLCGPWYQVEIRCACGKCGGKYLERSCSIDWVGFDEESGADIYRCADCGLELLQNDTKEPTEDPCQSLVREHIIFRKDGQVLHTMDIEQFSDTHTMVTAFTLLGETCEDGYYYKRSCQVCGYVEYDSQEDGHIRYDHDRELVSYEVVLTTQCGQHTKQTDSCACGQEYESQVYSSCNSWETVSYEGDMEIMVCPACELQIGIVEQRRVPTGTPCMYTEGRFVIFFTEEPFEVAASRSIYSHELELTTLTMLGETCDDGYTAVTVCQGCGETWTYGDTFYGCDNNWWCVEAEKLCDIEGTCGPVWVRKIAHCACDANIYYERHSVCEFYHNGWDEELDGEIYRCDTCGLEVGQRRQSNMVEGACLCDVTEIYTVRYDGQVVATAKCSWREEAHSTVIDFTLLGESCEDGWTRGGHCQNCDYTWQDDYVYTHHEVEYIGEFGTEELGCCEDSRVEIYSCACGQLGWFNTYMYGCNMTWDYEETDEYSKSTDVCQDCGITFQHESTYTPNEDPCKYHVENVQTLSMHGETLYSVMDRYNTSRHEYQTTQQLLEGATSCKDGVVHTSTCTNCGYSYSNTEYYHEPVKIASIDLAQYGSVCGGELMHKRCACGQEDYWSHYTECDLDTVDVEPWIENLPDTCWQYDSEGGHNTIHYFWEYRCAVTEPQCGLRLRRAEYWLVENCKAVEYVQWQYFDAETEAWVDILHEATGDAHPYHQYEYSWENTDLETGGRIYVDLRTCTLCGSYIKYTQTIDADGYEIARTEEFVELTDNGFNKRYDRNIEFVRYSNHLLDSRKDWYYTDTQGQVYGYRRREHTYGFPDSCMQYIRDYDQDGNLISEDSFPFHLHEQQRTWIKEPTCTQFGYERVENICIICGDLNYSYVDTYTPIEHNFCWDEALQTYVCSVCGLQNSNGASGGIGLEDMTAARGEGVNYVIGYYNRDNIEFIPNVTVILENAEGVQEHILLEGIEFTYMTEEEMVGVNAVSCSIQQVQDAVTAALQAANNIVSYAIRISFVPVGNSSNLDYAITFDTQTIA